MVIDEFYTPKILADKLVDWIDDRNINSIVDFCVGDGELLRAASIRWPFANYYGSDISSEAIQKTNEKHPEWQLSVLDFLDSNSRKKAKNLQKNDFDLILLNPPFSCIGATIHEITFNKNTYYVSTAMKFIAEAMNYLSIKGILYAILPVSVAYSLKDKKFWDYLVQEFNLSILEETSTRYFHGCLPNIIIVSINDFKKEIKPKKFERANIFLEQLEIFRGKISMNSIPSHKGDSYFVHTTNLRNNQLENLSIKLGHNISSVNGPALLIPRVGNPNPNKICLINEDDTYILSDCIIAIKVASKTDGIMLYSYFLENWSEIKNLYKGTGAKYITIDRIKYYLNMDLVCIDFQDNLSNGTLNLLCV